MTHTSENKSLPLMGAVMDLQFAFQALMKSVGMNTEYFKETVINMDRTEYLLSDEFSSRIGSLEEQYDALSLARFDKMKLKIKNQRRSYRELQYAHDMNLLIIQNVMHTNNNLRKQLK